MEEKNLLDFIEPTEVYGLATEKEFESLIYFLKIINSTIRVYMYTNRDGMILFSYLDDKNSLDNISKLVDFILTTCHENKIEFYESDLDNLISLRRANTNHGLREKRHSRTHNVPKT